MKVQCAQEALAEALTIVECANPSRITLPVLGSVLLEADATGGLRIAATNLELAISRRIVAAVTALRFGQTIGTCKAASRPI